MDTIRIGSLNTQNSRINRTGGITSDGKDNSKILAEHIEDSGYYFLGTQELTRVCVVKKSSSVMNSEWRQTLGTGVITENSTADLWEFSARLSANNNYF